MPPLVHFCVVGDLGLSTGLRRNDCERAPLLQLCTYGVVIECFVGDERLEVDVLNQRHNADAVVTVAWKKNEADQVAQSVDEHQGFGGQAAARSADGLILSPPFAPEPCRWTLTIVPSTNAYSKSGSPDKALKTFSNTPLSAQRRKRFQTVNQFPKASGRSRHGAPVRTIHKIPSRDRRLSSPLRPGSPFLPGRSGAICCHCASVRTVRIKAELHFSTLNQLSDSWGIPSCMRMSTGPKRKSSRAVRRLGRPRQARLRMRSRCRRAAPQPRRTGPRLGPGRGA